MTAEEAKEAIKEIPLGANIQLIKTNGDIIEVKLSSHEVEGTEEKDYGDIKVPALPAALIVKGGTRFGNYRLEIDDVVNIAWVEKES